MKVAARLRKRLTAAVTVSVCTAAAAWIFVSPETPETSGFFGVSVWNETADVVLASGSQSYCQLAFRTPSDGGGMPDRSALQPGGSPRSFRPNESGQTPDRSGQPPTGNGRPQESALPEDRLPDTMPYDFPEELYPYRAMLSGAEQKVYDQIYGNAAELYDSLPLRSQLSADSLARVMNAVFCDHPELFWLDTSYEYYYTAQGYAVSVTLSYNDAAKSIDAYRSRFEAAAKKALAGAQSLSTDAEKERYIHDYLLDNVSYDLDSALNQNAYSALVYGESVCAGYARAFQYLLQQLDIPCYYCTGYASESHAWNIVRLDDGYYNVDVAWNDSLGNGSGTYHYDYFNLSDAEIAASHTRIDLSVYLPACNATKNRYAA